jgi:hypothetical protein
MRNENASRSSWRSGFGRSVVVLFLLVALVTPGLSFAQDESDPDFDAESSTGIGSMIFDVVVLRPLSFTQLIVGGVLMIPMGLVSVIGGVDNFKGTADIFVGQPYRDTFELELGSF